MKNNFRKIFSKILVLVIFVGALFALTAIDNKVVGEGDWSSYAAEQFAGGNGTQANPYQIVTAEQFAKLSTFDDNQAHDITEDKYFRLMNDIDMGEHDWKQSNFYGYLDSADSTAYTIKNVTVLNDGSIFNYTHGLENIIFDNISAKSIINVFYAFTDESLIIHDCLIKNSNLCSGFVSEISSDNGSSNVEIMRCSVIDSTFSVKGENVYGIGGIVGIASFDNTGVGYDNFISYCSVYNCNFIANEKPIGGIIGNLNATNSGVVSINNCSCALTNISANSSEIGGIAGSTNFWYGSSAEIKYCTVYGGELNGSTTSIDTSSCVGGIVGYIDNEEEVFTISIESCSNSNSIKGGAYLGGLVGRINNGIDCGFSLSYNRGNISNSSSIKNSTVSYLGGLIGYTYGDNKITVDSCVNLGNVINNRDKAYVGGLFGYFDTTYMATAGVQLTNSYTAGIVKAVLDEEPTQLYINYDFGYIASANTVENRISKLYYSTEFNSESGIYVGEERTALNNYEATHKHEGYEVVAATKAELSEFNIGKNSIFAYENDFYVLPGNLDSNRLARYAVNVSEGNGTYEGEDITQSSLYKNTYIYTTLGEAVYGMDKLVDSDGYAFTPSIYQYAPDGIGEYVRLNQDVNYGNSTYYASNKIIENNAGDINTPANHIQNSKYIYRIEFAKNGGSGDDVKLLAYQGSSIVVPTSTYTKAGYNFANWNDGVNDINVGVNYQVSSNKTLTAQWTPKTIIVAFHKGNIDATGEAPADMEDTYENSIILPANTFALEGKVFIGWTDGNAVYQAGDEFVLPTDNTMLEAVWDDPKYTLTYDVNGGTGSMSSLNNYEGTEITIPTCTFTAPEDKVFRAWCLGTTTYDEAKAYQPGDAYTFTNENVTLYAIWETLYTLAFDANGGTGSIDSVQKFVGEEFTIPTCTFTTPENKAFKAWCLGTTTYDENKAYQPGNTYTFTDEDVTLYAIWETTYKITFNANGGTGSMEDILGIAGDEIVLPECTMEAPSGKKFRAWCTSSYYNPASAYRPGDTYTFTKANQTLYAIWDTMNTITFVPGDHGTGDNVAVEVLRDTYYLFPDNIYFTADEGWELDYWVVIQNGNPRYVYPGSSAIIQYETTARASWAVARLNLSFDGNGADSGSQDDLRIQPNEYGYLPECSFTKEGYTFGGWLDETTDIVYQPGVIYQMPEADRTLKARWINNSIANFKIGTKYAPTFESALAIASDGDTIKLLNNVVSPIGMKSVRTIFIDKDIIIDLNGYYISEYAGMYDATKARSSSCYYFYARQGHSLTIKDSSANENGYIEVSNLYNKTTYLVTSNDEFTLESGKLRNKVDSNRTKGVFYIGYFFGANNENHASFTMTGGTVEIQSDPNISLSQFNNNTGLLFSTNVDINITGGTFTGSCSQASSYYISSSSPVNMSGVTIDASNSGAFKPFLLNANATISNTTISYSTNNANSIFSLESNEEVSLNNVTVNLSSGYICYLKNSNSNITLDNCNITSTSNYHSFSSGSGCVTVNSGTFTYSEHLSNPVFYSTGTVTITGGTFISNKILKGTSSENVSGGRFSVQVPSNSVAEGYYALTEADGDGYYGVAKLLGKEDANAILNYGVDNEEYYASVSAAITAAQGKENAVVTVNKSFNENAGINPTGVCKVVIPDGITLTCTEFVVSSMDCSGETLLIEEGGELIISTNSLVGNYGTCTMTNNGTITTKACVANVDGWVNNGTITITSTTTISKFKNFTNNGTINCEVSCRVYIIGSAIENGGETLYVGEYNYNLSTHKFDPATVFLLVRNNEPIGLYRGGELSSLLEDGDEIRLIERSLYNGNDLVINKNVTINGMGYNSLFILTINSDCTLENFNLQLSNTAPLIINGDVNITLKGESLIKCTGNHPTAVADGNVTFSGDGEIVLLNTGNNQNAIQIDGDLVINADVTMDTEDECISIGQSHSISISKGVYKSYVGLYKTFDNEEAENFSATITGGEFTQDVKSLLNGNYHTMLENGHYFVRYLSVALDGAHLDYGKSLGLVVDLSINAYDEENIVALVKTDALYNANVTKVADNTFKVTYNDISMFKFSEAFSLQLNVDGESFELINNSSIKQVLVDELANTPTEALKNLIYSIIAYVDASQLYLGYDTENLLSKGIEGYVAPVFTNLESTDTNLVHATAIESIYACGVNYDYNNKLYAKFDANEIEDLKVFIDDSEVANEAIIALGNNKFKVYTEGFDADQFDKVFTFKVYDGETLIDTLEYSFASYVYAKQANNNENANLCKAAYNYYLASVEYLK